MCYDRGMSRKAVTVRLTTEERGMLETLAVSRTAPYRQVQRARLLLGAAAGKTNQAISQETGLGWRSVGMWRRRFIRGAGVAQAPFKRAGDFSLHPHLLVLDESGGSAVQSFACLLYTSELPTKRIV